MRTERIACALALQGKRDQAIYHFERALQLRPDYQDARRNLAQVLAKKLHPLKSLIISDLSRKRRYMLTDIGWLP